MEMGFLNTSEFIRPKFSSGITTAESVELYWVPEIFY